MFGIKVVKVKNNPTLIGNLIFAFYQFCDKDIRALQIVDAKTDNVCLSIGKDFKEQESTKVTLPEDAIREISCIVDANDIVYSMVWDCIEKPLEEKNCDERFIFSDGKRITVISSKNIWSHEISTAMEAPNAYIVLKIFDKIKRILLDNGIGKEWVEPLVEVK